MKRFFRFGKGKKDASSDTVSNVSSRRSSTSSANVAASPATGGYEIRDKDLGKIHKAIIKKDLDKVRRLASKETNVVDKESRTALHLAAATGFGAAMQELMQWKANLNVKDKDGKTPLHKAIENQHENCARMLLDARADPTCKDKDGNSSLHCAAKAGMFEIFKELRKSQKVISSGPDHPNSMGETPLHLATIARNLSICKFIVNSGVNIDAKDSKGFTALMLACQMGNDDLVSLLVEHNADTGIKDTNGWTAEDIAMNNGHAACRQAILQHQSHLPMHPDSHIYSTAESIHDEEDEEEADSQGKPASNVLKAVSDDKNASGDHQGTGDQQSTTDPKSWSDDDPLSEIEVTNKNKGFIYNNMTKNLNILPEKDDASATRQMNQRQNIVGLPPPSPSKAHQRSGIGDQAPLSARTISPRSWSNGDSHMDGLQASSNAGTREKPLPQKPQKGTEDSSDDDWTAEPSQSSQLSQPNKSQQEKLSQTKPDNRRTAADLGANDIYAAVNKGKTGDRKRMTDELGLDDAEVDDSEATSQMVTSLQSQDKIPKNIPTSARSAVSDWDSTVAEETPREFKPKAETSGKTLKETKSKNSDKDKHESDSPWDSEDGGSDDIPEIPELKTVELNKLDDTLEKSSCKVDSLLSGKSMNELLNEEQVIEDDIEAVIASSSSSSFLPEIKCNLNPGLEKVCEKLEDSHTNNVNYFDNVAGSCDWDRSEMNEEKIENPEDNAEIKEFEDGCGMTEKEKGIESLEEEEDIEDKSFANNITIENRQPESEIFYDRSTLLTDIGVDQSRLPAGDLTVDGSSVLHLDNLVTNEFNRDKSSEDKLSLFSLGLRPPEIMLPAISPEEEDFNEDKPIPQQIIDDDSELDESLDPIVYAQPNCDDDDDTDDLECLMNKDNASSHLENTEFDYAEIKAIKSVKQIRTSMTDIQIESDYTEGRMDVTAMLSQLPHADISKSEDLDESCMVPVEAESKMNTALPERSSSFIYPECSSIFRSESNASAQGCQSSAQVTNIKPNANISDTSCPGEMPLEKYLGELFKDKASKKRDIYNISNDNFKTHENQSGDVVEHCEEDTAVKDTEPEKYHLNGITAKQTETTKDVDSPERASSCSFSITDVSDVSEVKGSVVSDDDDDEEESTWEKERKTSKINKLEKQKSKSDVKIGQTYGAQLSYAGESKEVVFQQQPLKVDRVETWEISTTKSPASNEENELLLNNRPVLSSQVKESFREPLASVSNKMSFEESASDDQLSPRNLTARSISLNTDMNNVIRLQELIRDGQRKLETERSAKTLLENKRKSLENERAKLVDQLQVVTREKFTLDQVKIDLESKVRDLEYHLNEENEQRKNTDVLFEKTKEQLARKEKEILELTKAKQMTDTSLKNELKEKTSALTVAKQLEEEIKSLKKQLNEKNIFVVQDESSSSNQQSIIQSGALLRDKHFQLVPSFGSSPEIYATQMMINHEKERTKDDFEQLMRENEKLHKHNEELIEKMSRQEEALTHASLHYNIDLMQLKSDNNQLTVRSEKDTNAKEELSREVNSLKRQLSSVNMELQTALDAKAETERQRQQLADALSRSKEKQQQELDSTKNLFQSQSEQLSQVLPKMQKLESELMIVNTILAERTSQLGSLQKDHDKYRSSHGLMDESNAKLKEENIRLEAKVELLQERLNESQRELQSVKHSAEVKDINVERPEDLTILLSSLKAEHDRTKSHLDERNASLAESLSKAKEELKLTERGRINTEDEKRRLQTSLNEAQKQLLAAEATIEVNNQLKQQLEMERLQLKSEIDQLKDKLEDGRKKVLHQEQKVIELTHLLKTAENSAATSYEHLNKKNSSVHGLLKAKNELEENLHKLEVENAKLDAALTHEREKADMLQRDYSESKQSNNQLENECEKLKSSNTELQFLINEAAGLKTLATQEADDNRALWESEIRSRSKLGLRLAQLEREKRELDSKVQEEKRRVRRALELKKSTEAKLEEEQERSNHLQKEISTLKVHLKAAKKRIKEHHSHVQRISNSDHYLSNGTDSHILDNESDLIHENRYHSMELDYAKRQLHYDTEPKDYRRNRSATLASDPIQNMEHVHLNGSSAFHHDQMPLKFQMSASNYLGVSDVDRISEMLKTEAQMELNHKLQEVNRYLDDQAKAREHLDRIRNVNEAEMKKEFEKVRKEMLEEIAKVKYSFEEYATGQTDAVDNEAQQQIKDLHDRDGKLRNRLMARLDTAYSKVASSNLDYLHPVAFDQEFGALVDDELTKISNGHVSNDLILNNLRQQLDRSITRHMAAPANDRSEVTINSLHMDSLGSGRNSSNADTTSALNRNIQL